MELGLKNRVAFVSGGSKGIGRSIADALVKEGARVVITGRSQDALEKAARSLSGRGGKVLTIPCNATHQGSVRSAIEVAAKKFGGIDFLINNVGGIDAFGAFTELNPSDWAQAFELNVMSVVHHTQAALPWLKKSKQPSIINISSMVGVEPGRFNPHYSAMKAAVLNISKHLANSLAPQKIRVNAICAGPVHSDMWNRNVANYASLRKMSAPAARKEFDGLEKDKIPLKKIGEGNDVAGLALYLASRQANWITGSCFHADGGKLRSMT